jgi:hypothetical protein
VNDSGLLDLSKPFEYRTGFFRNRLGWVNVDLRQGTPLGDLFDALLDLALSFPADVLPQEAGRPLSLDLDDLHLDDFAKAQERWPGKKLKPLCRLMCAHFPQYRKVKPDTLRKRIKQRLVEQSQAPKWQEVAPGKYRTVIGNGAPISPAAVSNEHVVRYFTGAVRYFAEESEARKARKKNYPHVRNELIRALLAA